MTEPFVPFRQTPPSLDNTFDGDRTLRAYLRHHVPGDVRAAIEPELREVGELCARELYPQQLAERLVEPELTSWDAWGLRIDRIDVTPLWKRAEALTVKYGVIATAYERKHGPFSRVHQFALAYLFAPSTDIYNCPLAMTDGAAKTLLGSPNRELAERAVPHLLSRDPASFWTSGQWMTESTGGSDVGLSETRAERDADGVWRLYGRKWFTSAIASQMALTLARPVGNPVGGAGLALFYVETHDEQGTPNALSVHRLKDKLGTRKVPTAELGLHGTRATLVGETTHGTRHISPMLNVTRTWNAVSAIGLMQRALALASDYAKKRFAFGALLADKPLHADTLREMQAEHAAAFLLTFHLVEALGREESGDAGDDERALLRTLTPLVKLTTAKQAVVVTSEVLESFGGAGYVEDTGLPTLLRDAQVLPIWEGTTNVLSLDALKTLAKPDARDRFFDSIAARIEGIDHAELASPCAKVREALNAAGRWFASTSGPAAFEAEARRVCLTLGRALGLARLVELASLEDDVDARAHFTDLAQRFASRDIVQIRGRL